MSPMCAALFRPWAEAATAEERWKQPASRESLRVDTADRTETRDGPDNVDTVDISDTAEVADTAQTAGQQAVPVSAETGDPSEARRPTWPGAQGWLRPGPHSPPLVWSALQLLAEEESRKAATKRRRDKKFPCPKCPMTFSNKGQLTGHYRKHTG